MKYTSTAERVVPHEIGEFEDLVDKSLKEAPESEGPVILSPASPVPSGQFAVRAMPGKWIEIHLPTDPVDQAMTLQKGLIKFESIATRETRIGVTMIMKVSLSMWLALKLFGNRFEANKMGQEMIDEVITNLSDVFRRT